MATKRNSRRVAKSLAKTRNTKGKVKKEIELTSWHIVICYVSTLILVGFIGKNGFDTPSAYTFLAMALGLLFGRAAR